jgi:hypothetical protein
VNRNKMNTKFVNRLLLRWWVAFAASLSFCYFVHHVGGWQKIYEVDSTFICFIITGLYFVTLGHLGLKIRGLKRLIHHNYAYYYPDTPRPYSPNHDVAFGWFMSAQFLTLGLIGTVFGFVFCLKDGFDSVVATNPQTIQILLNQVSKGMGTALWTTIFGLLAALPIKFMLFYYETLIKKELNAD